ncbi:acyltransferase-like protein At3g26840, chloroplastic, partial [Carica papaya]|uniref:acyltransferase-like protein At3g26840, chloroplastic n=1 Tax=Carica papaya TaxID=3649 RepID=UPI000B8CCD0A
FFPRLAGIDGVGLGLIRQHNKLGKIFDIWCLHIPVHDRTTFTDLVKLVERAVRSENFRSPGRPIYIVGESLGGCIALAVAARNHDIDLVLILANPATSFGSSVLQALSALSKGIPDLLNFSIPYMLSSITGAPLKMVMTSWVKGLPLRQTIGELFEDLVTVSSYSSVLSNILPVETLEWKLQMLNSASIFANSQLDRVKAQTLILSSGNDQLLPNKEEGKRLRQVLEKCEIRNFRGSGHFLFLEDGFDLVSVLKGAYFYRRGTKFDYVSDFMPVTHSEFNKFYGRTRLLEILTGSVMFSTSEDGKIMKGLNGIPSEGPVLIVGHHMLLGFDLVSLPDRFFAERNIILRGMGHPFMFTRLKDGLLPDVSRLDSRRMQGGVPVSAYNLHKLLSSNSHVLLYPGGIREAMHRKGEEYTLFWPKNPEFVRIAAKFGATIIPFGVVGADDVAQVFFDYNDQMKIPFFRSLIESLTSEAVKLRADADGEIANQDLNIPLFFPKIPGRFYYYFGTPIKTKGRMTELKDKEKSGELYAQVKNEVERCIAFLKEKREYDPYRGLLSRLKYQVSHGFGSEVPTFDI